jgi:hypothetical protein
MPSLGTRIRAVGPADADRSKMTIISPDRHLFEKSSKSSDKSLQKETKSKLWQTTAALAKGNDDVSSMVTNAIRLGVPDILEASMDISQWKMVFTAIVGD